MQELMEKYGQAIPIVLIFIVMYFFIFRPQQQKAQKHKERLAALRKGDKVVVNGGIFGIVDVVMEQLIGVTIAPGVMVAVGRTSITEISPSLGEKDEKFFRLMMKKETSLLWADKKRGEKEPDDMEKQNFANGLSE